MRFLLPIFTASLTLATPIVVVSNLANGRASDSFVRTTDTIEQAFITDNQSYNLDRIIAHIGYLGVDLGAQGFARFYSDLGNAPGTLLGTFTFPAIPLIPTDAIFIPTGAIVLAANTKYWFLLGNNAIGTQYGWSLTNVNSFTGPGTIPFQSASTDTTTGVTTIRNDGTGAQLLQVNATPEPGPIGTVGFALAAVGVALHYRIRLTTCSANRR